MNSKTDARKIIGKLKLDATLHSVSPFLIGSSNSDLTDIDVLRDFRGMPIIPATSFIGVWRHFRRTPSEGDLLFGYSKPGPDHQSVNVTGHMHLKDLSCNMAITTFRDGIKLSELNGVVDNKFDYEIVEPGADFKLELWVDVTESLTISQIKSELVKLLNAIQSGDITFGRKTGNGLGRFSVIKNKLWTYNFRLHENVLDFLYSTNKSNLISEELTIDDKSIANFEIRFKANVKNSLIVRSAQTNTEAPDQVMLTSNNQPVLPGSSIKGPLRHHAFRILCQLMHTNDKAIESLMEDMWGFVKENGKGNTKVKANKSNVKVTEEVISGGVTNEIQTRIKIDRFTGGTIQGALIEEQPVFGLPTAFKKEGFATLNMSWKLLTLDENTKWQAGLLLFLVRDLAQGRIRFGGGKAIGRGVLEIISSIEVYIGGDKTTLELKMDENSGLPFIEDTKNLNLYIDAFTSKIKEKVLA